MAIDFSEDTTISTDEPQDEVQAEFSELVQGVEQSTEEPDEPEEKVEVEQEAREEEAAPPVDVVEGPSAAGKLAAEAAGIPVMIVRGMRNDDAIYELIEEVKANKVEDEPSPLALDLPEDEFPENDPVRGALNKIQSHFSEELNRVKAELHETASKATTLEKQTTESVKKQHAQMQGEFDSALDELGAAGLGSSKSMTEANIQLRTAAFNLAQGLQATNPEKTIGELAVMAAQEFGITNNEKTPQEKAAIRSQAKRRLGAGAAQPAEPELKSEEEQMRAFLVEHDFIRG